MTGIEIYRSASQTGIASGTRLTPLVYLLHASIMCCLHLFLPLLTCWFFVFAFACTHMERGHMELGHDFPGASKKGADASMSI